MHGLSSILATAQSWLVIFYLLVFSNVKCQFESPCPDIFDYRMDNNNEVYGAMEIPSPRGQRIQIDIELSVANRVQVSIFLTILLFFL